MSESFEKYIPPTEKEDPRITQAVVWLKDQLKHVSHGEVGFTLFLHDSEIRTIDRIYRSRER